MQKRLLSKEMIDKLEQRIKEASDKKCRINLLRDFPENYLIDPEITNEQIKTMVAKIK
jgi:hypothetical protein